MSAMEFTVKVAAVEQHRDPKTNELRHEVVRLVPEPRSGGKTIPTLTGTIDVTVTDENKFGKHTPGQVLLLTLAPETSTARTGGSTASTSGSKS